MKASSEQAQETARRALIFLSEDMELFGRFLALTGIGPAEIRARVDDPAFLVGVLDFVLGDERCVLAFAEWAGVDPSEPARARFALAGGNPC